jgi:hypothetical protein
MAAPFAVVPLGPQAAASSEPLTKRAKVDSHRANFDRMGVKRSDDSWRRDNQPVRVRLSALVPHRTDLPAGLLHGSRLVRRSRRSLSYKEWPRRSMS